VGTSKEVSMKPYSEEFRGEVLAACDRGRTTREVATYFDVSESWVRRVKQERREQNKGGAVPHAASDAAGGSIVGSDSRVDS
jgi:transposase